MKESRYSWGLLGLFVLLSVGFAQGRVPYDDEWYSLTLLTEASEAGFWRSLARDMHPPWLAMMDRALWSLWPERALLHFPRALACALAAALWLSLMRPIIGRRTWWLALALFHPIVFYYGGAHRWYPVLMLAHALRHWAILSPAASPHRRVAFWAGSLIGFMSSYVDLLFLVHDGAHYAYRERAQRPRALRTLALSLLGILLLLSLSPIAAEHWSMFGKQASRSWPLLYTALFAGLGPIGEAVPHLALLALGPLVVVAALWAGRQLVSEGALPQLPLLLLTLVLTWLVTTRFGVWSPRYSLELWWLMTLALITPFALGKGPRRSAGLSLSLVAMGLGCTLWGGVFFKGDLNPPPETLCESLAGQRDVDAYVIPYHRVTEQIRAACQPSAELLQMPHLRHLERREDLVTGLKARISEGGQLTLLALHSRASIRHVRKAARELLDARCTKLGERALWPQVHAWAHQSLLSNPPHRLTAIDYRCP